MMMKPKQMLSARRSDLMGDLLRYKHSKASGVVFVFCCCFFALAVNHSYNESMLIYHVLCLISRDERVFTSFEVGNLLWY